MSKLKSQRIVFILILVFIIGSATLGSSEDEFSVSDQIETLSTPQGLICIIRKDDNGVSKLVNEACSAIKIYPGPEVWQFYISNKSDFDIIYSNASLTVWSVAGEPADRKIVAVREVYLIECLLDFKIFCFDYPQLYSEKPEYTIKNRTTKLFQLVGGGTPESIFDIWFTFLVEIEGDTNGFNLLYFFGYP